MVAQGDEGLGVRIDEPFGHGHTVIRLSCGTGLRALPMRQPTSTPTEAISRASAVGALTSIVRDTWPPGRRVAFTESHVDRTSDVPDQVDLAADPVTVGAQAVGATGIEPVTARV
jgi:hypothetical protein